MPTAPRPVLHPGTGEPVGPDDLAPLFPMALILQEVSEDAEIAIPEEILDIYSLWRPTPLYRARRLEQAAGTKSRIFYKYEGVSPPRDRDLGGSRGCRAARRHLLLARQRAEPRAPASDGDRPGGDRADGNGGCLPRRRDRLRRRRLELRRPCIPVHPREDRRPR